MELKLIKHDEALKELKEVWSAWTIEQNAYTTPWMEQGNYEAPEQLSRTLTERRKWSVDHGQATHEFKQI